MMALLEFHLRCRLLAIEVVKCRSALQTQQPHSERVSSHLGKSSQLPDRGP